MPPQISDDETSDDGICSIREVTAVEGKAKEEVIEETQAEVESEKKGSDDNSDDTDDDGEQGADEFLVEAILDHLIEEDTGEILFQVKWEGYEKKSDRTWEPEANLATAPDILNAYLAKVGSREEILDQWAEKKAASGKGKKRGRASAGAKETAIKKSRNNGTTTSSGSPPAGAGHFRPPTGSWEDDVTAVDAAEGSEGKVSVFLTWKSGDKTQHPLAQVYKRCPQKMLKFYESHLVFKKNEEGD